MNRLRKLIVGLLNKSFYHGLDEYAKQANKIYNKKGNAVICKYCGKLLPKEEAAVVFDIKKQEIEYSHEACFMANEPHPNVPLSAAQEGEGK